MALNVKRKLTKLASSRACLPPRKRGTRGRWQSFGRISRRRRRAQTPPLSRRGPPASPLPSGLLDRLEQRTLGSGAALAGVAGNLDLAKLRPPARDPRPELFQRDRFTLRFEGLEGHKCLPFPLRYALPYRPCRALRTARTRPAPARAYPARCRRRTGPCDRR